MYLWLRRLHLWLTFASVFVLITLSVSGTLLVFGKEIQQTLQPQFWQVEAGGTALGADGVVTAVERHTGSAVHTLYVEQAPKLAWQARLADKTYVSVDPYTGAVLHHYQSEDTIYGFLVALHRTLLAKDSLAPLAKDAVSAASLVFCINALVGLWLWLKPKRRWQRLQFRKTRNGKAQLYQIHSIFGVYCILPLLLIAFSGMAFHWIAPTRAIVEGITGQKVAQPTHPRATTAGDVDLALALHRAQAVLPAATLHRIYFPKKEGDTLRLRMQLPGEVHPYSWVWIEPATAEVIKHFNASEQNLATKAWYFRYKFHIGAWWNLGVQSLWLILALLPTLWAVTGLWMYLKRRKTRLKARQAFTAGARMTPSATV